MLKTRKSLMTKLSFKCFFYCSFLWMKPCRGWSLHFVCREAGYGYSHCTEFHILGWLNCMGEGDDNQSIILEQNRSNITASYDSFWCRPKTACLHQSSPKTLEDIIRLSLFKTFSFISMKVWSIKIKIKYFL